MTALAPPPPARTPSRIAATLGGDRRPRHGHQPLAPRVVAYAGLMRNEYPPFRLDR